MNRGQRMCKGAGEIVSEAIDDDDDAATLFQVFFSSLNPFCVPRFPFPLFLILVFLS